MMKDCFMNVQNSNAQNIDTGLACFAIIANYFEKPISLDQIKHKYDRQNSNFEEYELLQLAREFSFKARFVIPHGNVLIKLICPPLRKAKTGLILFWVNATKKKS